ncbi:MAG TPA: tRNA (adenosine(37)-N6)-threonylcarbamoyltransferase complex dimerization subunit type 1 TsaB [Acidobacteriaceae bacterium]|nr:tRNA (adenosine(37)-N6)-threonylcarbamoyltransferase complex dimerization subunit type 1 TsaB [Acidobacteriaceae bacterium]
MTAESTLLLIDTVGDAPGAVLTRGDRILAGAEFPLRSASAVLLPELRRMFSASGISLRALNGIGVVSGPGSFTGVRTGLAMAKGLCEVAGVPLASISRLQLLAEAAGLDEGFALLDAGRGSLYIREQRRTEPAHEWLATIEQFERTAAGAPIVVAEMRTAELLAQLAPVVRELRPIDLLRPVERCLAAGGTNVAFADANYVLPESEIYTRPRHSPTAEAKQH